MSLINEALKKAQRLRSEQRADYSQPPIPGGVSSSRIAKRGQAMPAQTLVAILGGATVLIVVSAVFTAYLLNRSPEPTLALKATVGRNISANNPVAPSPVIIAPVVLAVNSGPEPAPSPAKPSTAEIVPLAPKEPSVAVAPETPIYHAPPPIVAPVKVEESKPREIPRASTAAPVTARPDPRIQAFVDTVRVAGIRYSGNESKVLMNDRVYRVNDVVERTLDVRLQQVAPDNLTFVDANGVTYVKNF